MHDAPCRREDLIAAYEDLMTRLDERRRALWEAYLHACRSMGSREYEADEHECWSVLKAGLAGIDAEQRVLQRDFESRLTTLDAAGIAV